MQMLRTVSTPVLLTLGRRTHRNITKWRSMVLKSRSHVETMSFTYSTVVQNSPECPITDRFENQELAPLLEVVVKEGIGSDDLLNALKISPELINHSASLWQKCLGELEYYGFKRKDRLRMLVLYPALMKLVERNELHEHMTNWINCRLGYSNMLDILAACPHFLSVSKSVLSRRIPLLQSLAKSRGKAVARLLQNCPGLMYKNLIDIQAVLSYVEDVMKVDTTKENLAKCYLFNRTLDEIKTRHIFLQRTGFYIKPGKSKGPKKEAAQQPWSKNPCISKITDTNDAVFVSEVAKGLTLEELEVFKEMYSKELNALEENDGESEDDFSDSDCD